MREAAWYLGKLLPGGKTPEQRAEALLRKFLTLDQKRDWIKNRAFNVKGKSGSLYRLAPYEDRYHHRLVRYDGTGLHAWPRNVENIKADWALGMMLYLVNNDAEVSHVACHDYVYDPTKLPKEYKSD